jgi:hypothetical protein
MRTKNWAPLILVSVVTVCQFAEAAGVALRSDTYLKICRIELSKGPYSAGGKNPIVFSGSVEKGWSYQTRDADYLCYRRSTDPANCWSLMSAYRCSTWTMNGQITLPLQ